MMKMCRKVFALMLCLAVLICSLASCGSGATAMKYGSGKISEADYAYLMAMVKGMIENNFKSYYGIALEDVYDEEIADGQTVAEYIKEQVDNTAKLMLVVEQLCKDAGITVSDPSTISEIDSAMQELEDQYGGADALNIELAKRGCNRESLERYEYFQALYDLLEEYRYGDEGMAKIAESDVKKAFDEQYVKITAYQYPLASYDNSGNLVYYVYDFGADYKESELKAFLMEQCMLAGYYTFEEKEDAEKAYNALSAGNPLPEELKDDVEESAEGPVYLAKAGKTIYADLIDKEPGTFLLSDQEEGWAVLYRKELTEDVYNDDVEKQLRETKLSYDAEKYFKENYRTVGHILYKTEEEANKVLAAIRAGETTFEDHIGDTLDKDADGNASVEYTLCETDSFEPGFIDGAFSIEIGEYCVSKSSYGYHLIERRELAADRFQEESVIYAMSAEHLMKRAKEMYENLKNGKAEFADPGEDADYYYVEGAVYQSSNLSEEIVSLLKDAENGEIVFYDAGASGAMIIRKEEMTDEDFKGKYDTVEETLIAKAYDEYLSEFFDSVTVVSSVVDKFDVRTSKSLAG